MIKGFILAIFFLCSSLYAYPKCSDDLKPALHMLYQFPETRAVIERAEKEGPFQIFSAPFRSNSGAMWDSSDRSIVINTNKKANYGQVTRSILFEMHNVISHRQFVHLDHLAETGKISKDVYVESVERIEYDNAKKTAALMRSGVSQGFFPEGAYCEVHTNFEDHFKLQKQCGHSQAIAAIYDQISRNKFFR